MEIKLEPITMRCEYAVGSKSTGIRYQITAVRDDEWGWGASVTVSSFGCKTPEGSIIELIPGLEDLLVALKQSIQSPEAF